MCRRPRCLLYRCILGYLGISWTTYVRGYAVIITRVPSICLTGARGRSAGVLLRHSPRRFVRLPSAKPQGRASVPPLGKMYTGIVTGNIVTEGVPLLTIGGPPLT